MHVCNDTRSGPPGRPLFESCGSGPDLIMCSINLTLWICNNKKTLGNCSSRQTSTFSVSLGIYIDTEKTFSNSRLLVHNAAIVFPTAPSFIVKPALNVIFSQEGIFSRIGGIAEMAELVEMAKQLYQTPRSTVPQKMSLNRGSFLQ